MTNLKRTSQSSSDRLSFLKRGASVFGVRVGAALAVFLLNVFLARSLGVDGFGLFSLALSLITVMSVLSRFGLDVVVLRDVAKESEAAHNGHADWVMEPIYRLIFTLSGAGLLVVALGGLWFSDALFNKPKLGEVIFAMSPLLLFLSVGYVLGEGLKAVRHAELAVFFQNALVPLSFMGIVYCWHSLLTPALAALLYATISVAALWVMRVYWNRRIKPRKQPSLPTARESLTKGAPLLSMSIGSLILLWSGVIILGVFGTASDVGIYSAASKVAMVTSLILVAVNAIVAPKFSQLYAKSDIQGLQALATKATRLMTVMVAVPTVVFLGFPEQVLSLFGSAFKQGAVVLMILTVGQFVNVACGSVGYMLTMTGHEVQMRNIMLGVAVLNVLLSIVLVVPYGVMGVAIATAISEILWNLLALYWVKRRLGFWMVG